VAVSRIFVHGLGAVSPAGWGVPALRDALKRNSPVQAQTMVRPGWKKPLHVRPVPEPVSRPVFFDHPRLRRANLIAQFTVAAALEALGKNVSLVQGGSIRLGIIVGVMAGGVNYSRRFYEEVLQNPRTASPMIFPETVFNAPASHLAAFLGSEMISYTLVGDDGTFLQGVAIAAQWLTDGKVDACLVIGAEETDWIVADAMKLFRRKTIHGAGAGAILFKKDSGSGAIAELTVITDSFPFTQSQSRFETARRMRAHLPSCAPNELLCCGEQDAAENAAWKDWAGARLAPKAILGEAFVAFAAWQCVAACESIRQAEFTAANISVVGVNQQAVGARFLACADAG